MQLSIALDYTAVAAGSPFRGAIEPAADEAPALLEVAVAAA